MIKSLPPAWPSSYVVWDLETTGLQYREGHIVEIGAVLVENGEIQSTHQWILDNEVPIPEEAAAVHGITEDIVAAEGRDPKDCLEEFLAVLIPGHQPHITHNGYRFDIPWIVHHLSIALGMKLDEAEELMQSLHNTMIDTAVLAKGSMIGMQREWNETMAQYAKRVMDVRAPGVKYNVSYICDQMGIDMEGITTHRAGGDVLLTNEIYKKIIQ